jgi:ribosome-binding protein aMBF1 (putative translation factor)
MSKSLKELKTKLLADPDVRKAYDEMVPEYEIARAIIKARISRGMTQAELAERMNTSQSFVARLERGNMLPTMKTLLRVAKATNTKAHIEFA